ncbi:MAG: type I 3-dehydroquinate dehydratase [Pirellulaceae bacterium]
MTTFAAPIELRRLLENRPTPIVATVRRPTDGGKWRGTERDRITILRTAVAEGADYVDLESDIAKSIPRYGSTKRIVSYHNFRETPDDLEAIYRSMEDLDPDVIKIATMANSPADNLKTLRLCHDAKIPTVAFCMGEIGMVSRLLCGRFGAPFTYATFSDERQLAPGQLTYRTMRDLYRYEDITVDTQVFGVIADPVAHSLSPLIHNRAFQDARLNAVYLPFRVPKDQLDEFMRIAPRLGVQGLSVTIPHKEEVLRYATALEPEVAGILPPTR